MLNLLDRVPFSDWNSAIAYMILYWVIADSPRQKVMKSRVKNIGEKMREISSTVTGYKVITTSLIIGFAAVMLFISVQILTIDAKLTDFQSKVAVIPAMRADIKQLQSDMALVKEKLEI